MPPGPDDVVSAANLLSTVANEGSFQWQWTLPPGIIFNQMWLTDGTRTSIVQISQISAANARDYSCQASCLGQSADSTIALQLNGTLVTLYSGHYYHCNFSHYNIERNTISNYHSDHLLLKLSLLLQLLSFSLLLHLSLSFQLSLLLKLSLSCSTSLVSLCSSTSLCRSSSSASLCCSC